MPWGGGDLPYATQNARPTRNPSGRPSRDPSTNSSPRPTCCSSTPRLFRKRARLASSGPSSKDWSMTGLSRAPVWAYRISARRIWRMYSRWPRSSRSSTVSSRFHSWVLARELRGQMLIECVCRDGVPPVPPNPHAARDGHSQKAQYRHPGIRPPVPRVATPG